MFRILSLLKFRSVNIYKLTCKVSWPFINLGKACFVCEQDKADCIPREAHDCPKCRPKVKLNQSDAQQVLEHMGAHILHDSTLNPSQEVCGFCLQPSPMCKLLVKKGCGASATYRVDIDSSSCINLIWFNYASAAYSSETLPCSNIPIICPLCPPKSSGVWTYSLHAHFCDQHKLTLHTQYPMKTHLSQSEKDGMKRIWDTQFNAPNTHNPKKKKVPALLLSEAHTSQSALQ